MNYCTASCAAKIVVQVNNIVLIVNGSFQVSLKILFTLLILIATILEQQMGRYASKIKQSFELLSFRLFLLRIDQKFDFIEFHNQISFLSFKEEAQNFKSLVERGNEFQSIRNLSKHSVKCIIHRPSNHLARLLDVSIRVTR